MTVYGVTPQGFVPKRLEDIKLEMQARFRSTFGNSVNLDDRSPFGQVIGIFADREMNLWELAEQIYNSQYPATAEGTNLDNVASITGAVRKPAVKSVGVVTLFGTVGTLIPKDSVVSVAGNSVARFNTKIDATILPGVDNVQFLDFSSIREGGQFTLNYDGEITSTLNWNDSLSTIQAAFSALSNVNDCVLAVNGTGYNFHFQNVDGSMPRPLIAIAANTLTSAEVTKFTAIHDVSGSLNRTTIVVHDAAGSVGIWVDLNNAGNSPPVLALAQDRMISVTGVNTNSTAIQVAAAFQAAISADAAFTCTVLGADFTITDVAQGTRIDGDGGDTGFSVVVMNQGRSAGTLPVVVTNTPAGAFPQVNVDVIAQTAGSTTAPAGSLTTIETPVTGWDSVNNALDIVPGAIIEQDPNFKQRRLAELAIAGRATTNAIRSKLLDIAAVSAVVVFENDSSVTDGFGRPAHSLNIVVEGGDNTDVANAIFDVVAAGIETIGGVVVPVLDTEGFSHDIKFDRPTPVPIYLHADITKDINLFPADGHDQVAAALLAFGESLIIGQSVIVYPKLIASVNAIPGIDDIVIKIGIAPSPTSDANIIIAPNEISAWDSSRIVVVVS